MLRAFQLGLKLNDIENIEEGMVVDMIIEAGNDHEEYEPLASQEDMDRF